MLLESGAKLTRADLTTYPKNIKVMSKQQGFVWVVLVTIIGCEIKLPFSMLLCYVNSKRDSFCESLLYI